MRNGRGHLVRDEKHMVQTTSQLPDLLVRWSRTSSSQLALQLISNPRANLRDQLTSLRPAEFGVTYVVLFSRLIWDGSLNIKGQLMHDGKVMWLLKQFHRKAG